MIVDASPQLPPRENLRQFIAEGADLVAFSGGNIFVDHKRLECCAGVKI